MYKSMLIATDGSEISKRATRHGMHLAKVLAVPVTAVFVIDTRALPLSHPIVPEAVAPYYHSLLAEMRSFGEAAVGEIAAEGAVAGVPVEWEVIEGTPAAGILATAKKISADLIVMGTHGRSAIGTFFLGSTAQAVCHGTHVPVLLVR